MADQQPAEPAQQPPRERPPSRPAAGSAAEAPLVPDRAGDDSDVGWSERREDSRDEDLRRDVPPHW